MDEERRQETAWNSKLGGYEKEEDQGEDGNMSLKPVHAVVCGGVKVSGVLKGGFKKRREKGSK